jgi:hypothetical protein
LLRFGQNRCRLKSAAIAALKRINVKMGPSSEPATRSRDCPADILVDVCRQKVPRILAIYSRASGGWRSLCRKRNSRLPRQQFRRVPISAKLP